MGELLAAILLGPLLWLVGAVVFDGVHWILHVMLRSRLAVLRVLAWPHAVHHRWIDRRLETHLELRAANVFCHIVPEYLTQLVYTGVLALLLPAYLVGTVFVLQTALFLGILAGRGQDLNHRPAARIDAHRPGWTTPPAYHALHHAWPDAYYSAYTKVVDWVVGSGAQIAERGFALVGSDSALATGLRTELERLGGETVADAHRADVVVLLDPAAALDAAVESLIDATRDRQLPPEVWAVRVRADDPLARHYRDDVRVCFRTLLAPVEPLDAEAAAHAARRALFWIRRDAHFVSLRSAGALAAWRRFRGTRAVAPEGASGAGRLALLDA